MKICTSAMLVAAALANGYVHAAGMDDIKISGFGSVGVGMSNNDVGYAGYSDNIDTKQDTLLGIQFDFQINDKAKVTTQLVANGRYDFEPAIEVAYLSYQINSATVRGGKLRTPLFMYSDYLDVGYAYPMLRPSQEIYENLIISSFTGVDALIPVAIGDTTLQLQPVLGVSQVEERDSNIGKKVDIEDIFGLAATWYVDDWTFRGSYAQGKTEKIDIAANDIDDALVAMAISGQKAAFLSLGAQYNNGSLLFNTEAMQVNLDGIYPDVEGISALVGYQFGAVMPYIASGWIHTSDDDKRPAMFSSLNYERTSYSVGARWDFARNMAAKLDVTYADFGKTNGGLTANSNIFGKPAHDDVVVYSASIDFVF